MAGAYSQDLRDRVINAVVVEKMGSRAGGGAVRGQRVIGHTNGWSGCERSGSRTAAEMGGYERVRLEPHRAFLQRLVGGEIRHRACRRCAIGFCPSAAWGPTPR